MDIPSRTAGDVAEHGHLFFQGGGKLGSLMRRHAWHRTSFGHPDSWSSPLRNSVSLCLSTAMPSCIYWGPELCMLYNDAWSLIPGRKHPGSLGLPAREVWDQTLWPEVQQHVRQVLESGASCSITDQLLPIEQNGVLEERYYTHISGPIRSEAGGIGGVFKGSVETTAQKLGERRAAALQKLAGALMQVSHPAQPAAQALSGAKHDLPFLVFFERTGSSSRTAQRRTVTGGDSAAQASTALLPEKLKVDSGGRLVLPIARRRPAALDALPPDSCMYTINSASRAGLPKSVWGVPVQQLLSMPLRATGGGGEPRAWLLCGLSPMLPLDAQYCAFFRSLADLLGAALSGRQETGDAASAIEASRCGVWNFHPETEQLHLSPRGAALLGISEWNGKSNDANESRAGAGEVRRAWTAALKGAADRDGEVSLQTQVASPGKGKRWLRLQGGAFVNPDGERRITGLVSDFTREHGEQETRCAHEKLALTARVAATIAHEMNNPLESLTNLLYLASLDEGLSDGAFQLLQLAETELARVSFSAQLALGFHRDETGATRVELQPLVRDLLLLLERRSDSRGVRVDMSRVRALSLHCRAGELRQLISSLLMNALAASVAGDMVRLSARISRHWLTGEELMRLSVADYGSGIAGEHRGEVFKPFFTTRNERNSGLGLWVTKTILDKQQGSIRFRSRPGRPGGTCFMITLPTQIRRSTVQ